MLPPHELKNKSFSHALRGYSAAEVDDYIELQRNLGFNTFMGSMIDNLKNEIMNEIDNMDSMQKIEAAEFDLLMFCNEYKLNIWEQQVTEEGTADELSCYIDYSILLPLFQGAAAYFCRWGRNCKQIAFCLAFLSHPW